MSEDLRYPIGRFQYNGLSSDEQRAAWIDELESAPDALVKAVSGLTESQLDTPYRPEGWTVRQLIHHLADSHMNSYIRFKWALTEENPTIKPYDEKLWAQLIDSATTPVATSLALFSALMDRWVHLLRGMSVADFQKTFVHPVSGVQSLDRAVGVYAWHSRHHIAHITSLRERMGWMNGSVQ